jgi:hypothetical protein
VAVALAAGAACVSGTGGVTGSLAAPAAAGDVRLLGASAVWAGTLPAIEGLRVGSVSALAFDAASGRWLAAIDDINTPRIVWFDIARDAALHAVPVGLTRLTAGPDAPADALTALDMEGLAVFPDGGLAISHEGHIDRQGIPRQPRILLASRDGVVTEIVRPRDRFRIRPNDFSAGVRHNLGLESLTLTPDGRLVSGLEQPLAQDGPVTSRARGGVVRLVEFVPEARGWAPGREWAYALDPTPTMDGYAQPCEDGENGLSELLALTDTTFLAVERACLRGAAGAPAYNPVRVFEVSTAQADDVSAVESLSVRRPHLAEKRLLVDLATWRAQLPPTLATLSNIEGMAFGPAGPAGERTVMLVSDDNFRATQTTAFVWLALGRQPEFVAKSPPNRTSVPGPLQFRHRSWSR